MTHNWLANMDSTIRLQSEFQFARAKRLMPGGVNSPARAFGGVGGEPIFIDRADGPYLFDIDGNRYIDYIGSWGPMILGHRHPRGRRGRRDGRCRRGTSFGAPTEAESELAELIIEAVPVDRDGAAGQLRHRSHDERHPPGPRLHRPRRDRQVRRQLPRPRR